MIERSTNDARTAIVLEDLAQMDVVHVFGEIDTFNAPQLEAVMAKARAAIPLIVDLTGCAYMDSAVLTVLVRARQRLGSSLRIAVAPEGTPRRVFRITGLDVALNVYESLEDAMNDGDHVVGNVVLAGSPTWFHTA